MAHQGKLQLTFIDEDFDHFVEIGGILMHKDFSNVDIRRLSNFRKLAKGSFFTHKVDFSQPDDIKSKSQALQNSDVIFNNEFQKRLFKGVNYNSYKKAI